MFSYTPAIGVGFWITPERHNEINMDYPTRGAHIIYFLQHIWICGSPPTIGDRGL